MEKEFGKLDILINNAGILKEEDYTGGVMKISLETLKETINTNVIGTYSITQKMIPLLKKSSTPRIVNVSSGYGQLKHMEHMRNSEYTQAYS